MHKGSNIKLRKLYDTKAITGSLSFISTKSFLSVSGCVFPSPDLRGSCWRRLTSPQPNCTPMAGPSSRPLAFCAASSGALLPWHLPAFFWSEETGEKPLGEPQQYPWKGSPISLPTILQGVEGEVFQSLLLWLRPFCPWRFSPILGEWGQNHEVQVSGWIALERSRGLQDLDQCGRLRYRHHDKLGVQRRCFRKIHKYERLFLQLSGLCSCWISV